LVDFITLIFAHAAQVLGQSYAWLEVRIRIESQVVLLEERSIDIQAQITIESHQNRLLPGSTPVKIDVTQSPGEAPPVTGVGNRGCLLFTE
jgi:hypothetical protein